MNNQISAIKGVYALLRTCVLHGVKHVVVSPGSRNAPLSITLEAMTEVNVFVVPDERSAGFFALGISLATQQPVALVCTSGSAALNYAPAVSEAYYQKIPLVVITADRPQEWINQNDGQTIVQENVYGKHVLFSCTLPLVRDDDTAWYSNRLVNQAMLMANGNVKGPVHLNVPLKEPLYEVCANTEKLPRIVNRYAGVVSKNQELPQEIIACLTGAKRMLFLAGQMHNITEAGQISKLLNQTSSAVVLTETTTNISAKCVISTIDRIIDGFTPDEKREMAPDVLVTFGDAVVSKKVKAWLRSNQPKHHIHIGFEHTMVDTFQCLTHWVEAHVQNVLDKVLQCIGENTPYAERWQQRARNLAKKHALFMENVPWSDLCAFDVLLKNIKDCNLHLGNSSPIRYVQLFQQNKGVNYFSNRGTSGIDGSTSTAAGFAAVDATTNILVTGDISFYYDSNALWNNYLKGNFKIVLINNKGGNIFRIIDGPSSESITQKYFEAKQEMNAQKLCEQFGIAYATASNKNELEKQCSLLCAKSEVPMLVEVFTDNVVSPQTLKDYFNALKH